MNQLLTDQEVIENIELFRAKHPKANRTQLLKAAKVGIERFNRMVDRKLIKLPPPDRTGRAKFSSADLLY